MTGRPTNKPRRFKGFAVIERPAGALVWGSFRPSAAEARAIYAKWNPGADRAEVVAVEISIFDSGRPDSL